MAVGLFGVLLLVRGRGFSAAPVGLVALGIGNVAWALGSVLSQRKFALAQGGTGFASEMLCGGTFLVLLSLCTDERFRWPAQPAALNHAAYLACLIRIIVQWAGGTPAWIHRHCGMDYEAH